MPTRITFNDGRKIEFIYDATGKKWRKTVINANGTSNNYRDYIGDAEYLNGAQDIVHFTEGYAQRDITTDGGTLKGWVYKYTLKDHLGNTRVTYSDKNSDGLVTTADIEQVNHYYAFGLNMEGPWNGADGAFKYQYNGKELNSDFGLDWNDYGARMYDPAIGRWTAIDPLSALYFSHSPYHYTKNNPVRYIDIDGMVSYTYDWNSEQYHNEKGETVSWNEVESSVAKPKITANIANFGTGKGDIKGFGEMLSTAATILNRNLGNSDNSQVNIMFKPLTVKEAKSREEWGENDLFLAIVDWGEKSQNITAFNNSIPGFSRIGSKDGRVNGYNNISDDNNNFPYKFGSWVNVNNYDIRSHGNPIYAAGYSIAHELLHQLMSKATCLFNGKADDWHTVGLSRDGTSTEFPKGLRSKGLNPEERIPEEKLKLLIEFFKR